MTAENEIVRLNMKVENNFRELLRKKSKARKMTMTRYVMDLVYNDTRPSIEEGLKIHEDLLELKGSEPTSI